MSPRPSAKATALFQGVRPAMIRKLLNSRSPDAQKNTPVPGPGCREWIELCVCLGAAVHKAGDGIAGFMSSTVSVGRVHRLVLRRCCG